MFTYTLSSRFLKRPVTVELFIPHDTPLKHDTLELLLLNDGQDKEQLHLMEILHNVYADGNMKPMVIAAVYAGKRRIDDYGVAGIPDYKRRGKTARQYQQFLVTELIPFVHEKIRIKKFRRIHIAGFSMGALSAFDTAWKYDHVFYSAGCFSGSFWWRSRDLDKDKPGAQNRIVHRMVSESLLKPNIKFWFECGTNDENNDRNHNGVIDSIDDTIDLIEELKEKGYKMYLDIYYREVQGGRHDFETWRNVFPEYLVWLNYI
jgi:enterochelin esterase family protein